MILSDTMMIMEEIKLTPKIKLIKKIIIFYKHQFYFIFRSLILKVFDIKKNEGTNNQLFIKVNIINFLFNHLFSYKRWKQLFTLLKYDQSLADYISKEQEQFNHKNFKRNYKFLRNNSKKFIDSLNFKAQNNTKVSIIIPTYEDFFYTALCLKSLSSMKTNITFEIILVDDSRVNHKINEFNHIKNITIISNPTNLGYIESCNIGAKKAVGDYIYLLNNDTYVTDFAIDNLIEAFNIFPNVGAVGSKLFYEDLTLQECGGLISTDGKAYRIGTMLNGNLSKFNFTQIVDYCSAASLLLKKNDYHSVGGLSSLYKPAYYEDVDLSFKLKQKKLITLVTPKSSVIHLESKSLGHSGTNVKNKQLKNNRIIFLNKWKKKLSERVIKKDLGYGKTKNSIIIFEENIITPLNDAGSLSIFNFAKIFQSLGFHIVFIFKHHNLNQMQDIDLLEKHGFQVLNFNFNLDSKSKNIFEKTLSDNFIVPKIFYLARPEGFYYFYNFLSLFFTDHLHKNIKVIYDTLDLHFLRLTRESQVKANKENLLDTTIEHINIVKRLELHNIKIADLSLIRSNKEISLLVKEMIPKNKLFNLSLVYQSPKIFSSYKDTEGIFFVANFLHLPNVDALYYLLNDIYPYFSNKLKKVNLYIVGKNGRNLSKVKKINKNIIFIDFIEDINKFICNRRINIAPLRYGAGVKGKIAQALINGIPTISNEIGFEGMTIKNRNAYIASNSQDFARKIEKLYFNKNKWYQAQKDAISSSKQFELNHNRKRVKKLLIDLGMEINDKKYKVNLL